MIGIRLIAIATILSLYVSAPLAGKADKLIEYFRWIETNKEAIIEIQHKAILTERLRDISRVLSSDEYQEIYGYSENDMRLHDEIKSTLHSINKNGLVIGRDSVTKKLSTIRMTLYSGSFLWSDREKSVSLTYAADRSKFESFVNGNSSLAMHETAIENWFLIVFDETDDSI